MSEKYNVWLLIFGFTVFFSGAVYAVDYIPEKYMPKPNYSKFS